MSGINQILLESGTNELEIVEFAMGPNKFGINVNKVREIINPVSVVPIPHAHPHILGIMELRGEVLPVISIERTLNTAQSNEPDHEKFIVAEFNQQKFVFHVHNVIQIHRISWSQIEKASDMYQGEDNPVLGIIKMDHSMILMLDFEKIITDINPQAGITIDKMQSLGERERSMKKIVIAEDSPMLRRLLKVTLNEAGFSNLTFFENGSDCLDYLQSAAKKEGSILEEVQIVITDIEMPMMDGHHLTKRIKEDATLKEVPVIIFSSLITDDLRHKGQMVGADAQVSKPEIEELVKMIDVHVK
ncbi:chemotaxis protein [Cytobacillus horneckiae]|uniref:chemotaxis protein n=1 Tax=Cytobacillus horneckiae TaxID=549687 RepID=UPI0034CF8979